MILNPPTPLQWKALQESVVIHRNNQLSSYNEDDDSSEKDRNFAVIDAAPLIAIIDEHTGSR